MSLNSSKVSLTNSQRDALKTLAHEGGLAKSKIHHRTFKSLLDLGLVKSSGQLTEAGTEQANKRGRGRPPKDGANAPRRPQFPITLPPDKLKRLDDERGDQSRADFFEALLDQYWASQS